MTPREQQVAETLLTKIEDAATASEANEYSSAYAKLVQAGAYRLHSSASGDTTPLECSAPPAEAPVTRRPGRPAKTPPAAETPAAPAPSATPAPATAPVAPTPAAETGGGLLGGDAPVVKTKDEFRALINASLSQCDAKKKARELFFVPATPIFQKYGATNVTTLADENVTACYADVAALEHAATPEELAAYLVAVAKK